MGEGEPDGARSPSPFSLRRRVQLTLVMLALESFVSFEEIFMLPVLQRVDVPVLLVSLPGTISSAIGVFVIPLLGWASDRRMFWCSKYCGQKRPFAVWTLAIAIAGVGILIYVSASSLYDDVSNDDEIYDDRFTSFSTMVPSLENITVSLNNSIWSLDTFTAQDLPGDPLERRALTDNTSDGLQSLSNRTTTRAVSPQPGSWQTDNATDTPASPPSQADNSSTTSEYLTTMGILGIVGFVLADHGYDSSMSTFKAYMIAVMPATQHDDLFILGTLTAAVGGCVTSLLGFVDLGSLLPDRAGAVLDKGMGQSLIQALILLTKLGVLGFVSMMTGSENFGHVFKDAEFPSDDSNTDIDLCDNVKKDSHTQSSFLDNSNHTNKVSHNENTLLISEPFTGHCGVCFDRVSVFWGRRKRRVLLCCMTFFGLSADYSYFVYVSNYVAEVIYKGDPNADTESEAYGNYVDGVHVASLGMLTFYLLFVVFNIFHQKILRKIGMRTECMGSSICCAALLVTLALTDNIVIFFLNAVTMATSRAAVYTVPFILSNNLAKEEAKELNGNSAMHSAGVAMATISAMIPASYFVVSLIMGPLMDLSGYPGMPIIVAAGSCVLNIMAAFFVHFD